MFLFRLKYFRAVHLETYAIRWINLETLWNSEYKHKQINVCIVHCYCLVYIT